MKNPSQKRFGAIAIEKGFISKEQLLEALQIQAEENIEKGTHRLIGQILIEKGYITQSQVDKVLAVINNQMMYIVAMAG